MLTVAEPLLPPLQETLVADVEPVIADGCVMVNIFVMLLLALSVIVQV
jgi:hypothetical protein